MTDFIVGEPQIFRLDYISWRKLCRFDWEHWNNFFSKIEPFFNENGVVMSEFKQWMAQILWLILEMTNSGWWSTMLISIHVNFWKPLAACLYEYRFHREFVNRTGSTSRTGSKLWWKCKLIKLLSFHLAKLSPLVFKTWKPNDFKF